MIKYFVIGITGFLAMVSTQALVETSVTASDGVRYELAGKNSPGVVQLWSGESRTVLYEICSEPVKVDWLHLRVSCTSAEVVTATDSGVQKTGGSTTSKIRLRMELVLGMMAMVFMALAMLIFRIFGISGAATIFTATFAVFAATAVAIAVGFSAAIATATAVAFTAFTAAFITAFTAAAGNKELLYRSALIFEGLMLTFLFLVW